MKGFLLYFVLPVTAIGIFFSGSFPHTLIYDVEDLRGLKFEGKEPVSAEVVNCDMQNADSLTLGAAMESTFRATLKNNTNRYVVISAIGEVFNPNGRSSGMHS